MKTILNITFSINGLSGYQLTFIPKDGREGHDPQILNLEKSITSYTFRNLIPGTLYQVAIRTKTKYLRSSAQVLKVTTLGLLLLKHFSF